MLHVKVICYFVRYKQKYQIKLLSYITRFLFQRETKTNMVKDNLKFC